MTLSRKDYQRAAEELKAIHKALYGWMERERGFIRRGMKEVYPGVWIRENSTLEETLNLLKSILPPSTPENT